MKHLKFSLMLLSGVALFLATIGCAEQKKEAVEAQMLVVERQSAQLSNHIDCDSYTYYEDVAVDVPLYGPQPLMDSLKVFLNKELYDFFSWTVDSAKFSQKELYQDNLTTILSYYENKYKPYQGSICNHYSFNLFVIAQTESFITYGLEFCNCGANCGSEFYCYTFSKKDGHRCDIIDEDNLSKYVKKRFPDSEYEMISDGFSLGLLEDGLLIAEQEASNHHYVASRVETQELLPYLSKDAKELINTKGKTEYLFENWSLGKYIGNSETIDGDSVVLMQRVSWWGFQEGENEDLLNENAVDKDYPEVVAYTMKDGCYVPCKSELRH